MRSPLACLLGAATLTAFAAPAAAQEPDTGGAPGAPDNAPATEPAPATTPAISDTQTVPLTHPQMRSVQRKVHVRPDGVLGPRTRTALRVYQGRRDLLPTGRPNLQTLRSMDLPFARQIAQNLAGTVTAAAVFPIQGEWHYGSAATTFGARAGEHQGVDLFADCGTPLVAASAGVVKTNRFQAAAGNYVVLTDTPGGEDQVYMHLEQRSPVAPGTSLAAGDPIGQVGDTGDAQGCHLHFELWSAPGWYRGGAPHDPQPELDAWADTAGNPAAQPA